MQVLVKLRIIFFPHVLLKRKKKLLIDLHKTVFTVRLTEEQRKLRDN